jgi:hypothetical protein
MDNRNWPIIAVNVRTGKWEKVLDSQLKQAVVRLGEGTELYRVDKNARVIRRKKDGRLVIRGISFPLDIFRYKDPFGLLNLNKGD